MGAVDVLCFLIRKKEQGDDKEGFSINDISKALKQNGDPGNSYKNVRLALLKLEARSVVKGHCRGRGDDWQRYFKLCIR